MISKRIVQACRLSLAKDLTMGMMQSVVDIMGVTWHKVRPQMDAAPDHVPNSLGLTSRYREAYSPAGVVVAACLKRVPTPMNPGHEQMVGHLRTSSARSLSQ
jgi:hypothetical protein